MFRRRDYQTESGKLMAYAWPGGYPLYYVCKDGGVLCPEWLAGRSVPRLPTIAPMMPNGSSLRQK